MGAMRSACPSSFRAGLRKVRQRAPTAQVATGEIPVDQMLDDRVGVVGTTILVVEIVGMLPHVDREQRGLPIDKRCVGVCGPGHLECIAVEHQPGPAAAKLPDGSGAELLGEAGVATEVTVDPFGDLANRHAAAGRLQRAPVEGVVPGLGRIVEQGAMAVLPGGLPQYVLEWPVGQTYLLCQRPDVLHVDPMVLAMMDLQRGSRDVRLQRVVRIRKFRQGDLHCRPRLREGSGNGPKALPSCQRANADRTIGAVSITNSQSRGLRVSALVIAASPRKL